nr:MAG TPA: hypothetical protein [Caudoviricetes sp.]
MPGFFQSEARGCVRIRLKLERRAVFCGNRGRAVLY